MLYPWMKGTPVGDFGFPTKTSKHNSWNNVPFISCKAGSAIKVNPPVGFETPLSGKASQDPNDCSPNTAHYYNKGLKGVNAAYADGHIEMHTKRQMVCGYVNGTTWWFY